MRAAHLLLAGLALLVACVPADDRALPPLPADVTHVAVVAVAGGAARGALYRLPLPDRVVLPSPLLHVYGYRGLLPGLEVPDEGLPIASSPACAPGGLPAPSVAWALDDQPVALEPAAALPLAAPTATCPGAPPIRVAPLGGTGDCRRSTTAPIGCWAVTTGEDPNVCRPVRWPIRLDGSLCSAAEVDGVGGPRRCEPLPLPRGAWAAADCSDAAPRRFGAYPVESLPVELQEVPLGNHGVNHNPTDLALFDDHVLVLVRRGTGREACFPQDPATLLWVDRARGVITSSRATAACTFGLVVHPDGGHWATEASVPDAADPRRRAFRLHRHDARGEVVQSSTITLPPELAAPPYSGHHVVDLLDMDSELVVLVTAEKAGLGEYAFALLSFDRETLAPRAVHAGIGHPRQLVRDGQGVAFSDDASDNVRRFVVPIRSRAEGGGELPPLSVLARDGEDLYAVLSASDLRLGLRGRRGEDSGLDVVGEAGEQTGRALFVPAPAHGPQELLRIPGNRALAFLSEVRSSTSTDQPSWVTVLDLEPPPSDDLGVRAAPIGVGRVQRARFDAATGEAWVLLLTAQSLVRVRLPSL